MESHTKCNTLFYFINKKKKLNAQQLKFINSIDFSLATYPFSLQN